MRLADVWALPHEPAIIRELLREFFLQARGLIPLIVLVSVSTGLWVLIILSILALKRGLFVG